MTRARLRRVLAALVLGALASGCASGTETGNPDETSRLTVGARPGSAPAGLTLSEARVSLPSVLLTPCGASASPLLGPETVDLLAPDAEPAVFDRPARDACGATVELGPSALSEPPELSGLTLLFGGVREDGTPFEVRSTLSHPLVLVTTPPHTAFDARRSFLAFDLGVWLDAAGVPGLAVENGVVVIDAATNPAALAALEGASVHALSLHADANGDGRLEGAELTPVAVPE